MQPQGRTGAQCAPLRGTAMQPSVANAAHRCDFCHVVGARIARPPTLFKPSIFPPQRPPSSREGDRRSGGRSSRIARPPTFCRLSISLSPYLPHRGRGTARRRWKEFPGGGRHSQAPEGVKNPAGRDFSLGGVSFMPLGISPADEHRRPRRTASLRWRSRPARRRRLHR